MSSLEAFNIQMSSCIPKCTLSTELSTSSECGSTPFSLPGKFPRHTTDVSCPSTSWLGPLCPEQPCSSNNHPSRHNFRQEKMMYRLWFNIFSCSKHLFIIIKLTFPTKEKVHQTFWCEYNSWHRVYFKTWCFEGGKQFLSKPPLSA